MFDNREIIEFCDVVTYFAEKQYQNDEEKNEFFNSFISRVVLFDDCVYIFYNTSPNMPTKVKLDKSDLAELREYRTNKKSTQFQPLGFKLGACGGGWGIRTPVGLRPNGFQDRLVMTASISLRIFYDFRRDFGLFLLSIPRLCATRSRIQP